MAKLSLFLSSSGGAEESAPFLFLYLAVTYFFKPLTANYGLVAEPVSGQRRD